MQTTTDRNDIARTTFDQLGGRRAMAMIGGRAVADGSTLTIRMAARRGNVLQIVLDPSDTYTITMWGRTPGVGKRLAEEVGIYADQLRGCVERMTGLYLSITRSSR